MICVVSHDAGGAEVLASYVAQQGLECAYVLGGPAISVFERRLGRLTPVTLEEGIARADWILCGTSWQSDIEWRAIDSGRAAGKRTAAFLDHWGHYRERFIRNGIEHLPDEIWVGDAQAESLAGQCFSGRIIRLVPNPFFEDIKRQVAAISKATSDRARPSGGLAVLFVCEPLSEHGLREFGDERHWGYTEYDALRFFFRNIHVLGQPVGRVVVRPHPAEPPGKYDWVRDEFGGYVTVGGDRALLEEIAESDIIAGCQSMAMVIGLIAGRRAISCIPPEGMACSLPQLQIESLQSLIRSAT